MAKQSRRQFITTTAAVAAAPFIVTSVTRANAEKSRKKLGFAICGLGGLSKNQILPAIAKTKNCKLAGFVTGTPAKRKEFGSQYSIPERSIYSYDDMHRMADNKDIDVVYVVTPNSLHAQHTIAAANAGKHVFSEKPMEVSTERCQQMIDACKKAGRMLGVAYRSRFDPYHIECIRLVREQVFGAPKIIDTSFCIDVGRPDQWRLNKALSGGGALMDVGIYCLQATRYLSGEEPVQVSAMETKTDPVKFAQVDESMVWTTRFPSGVIAHCSTSFKVGRVQNMRVNAERGWFELDPAFFYNGNHGRRSDGEEIKFPEMDRFAAEMDDFADCILEGKPSSVSGEEGLRDVRILTAIYESARTGKAVSLA
ncbi:MAG: Gfo/Idh/MocA family protein [Povalibacter sp.]